MEGKKYWKEGSNGRKDMKERGGGTPLLSLFRSSSREGLPPPPPNFIIRGFLDERSPSSLLFLGDLDLDFVDFDDTLEWTNGEEPP